MTAKQRQTAIRDWLIEHDDETCTAAPSHPVLARRITRELGFQVSARALGLVTRYLRGTCGLIRYKGREARIEFRFEAKYTARQWERLWRAVESHMEEGMSLGVLLRKLKRSGRNYSGFSVRQALSTFGGYRISDKARIVRGGGRRMVATG